MIVKQLESNKSVNREIIRLSMPTMVGLLLQGLYDVVDMIWIGFIDPAAIAAATLFNMFFWMVEVLNEIVGTSSVALISQAYGAKDDKKSQLAMEQTLIFKFVLAIIGSAILALTLPFLFDLFTNDPLVKEYGLSYGFIRVAFIPLFFSSFSVNTIFRCTNDAKTPMKLLVVTAILNMLLDPLLMFEVVPGTSIKGLGWGMKGAAIATVFSISVAFVVGFILLLKRKEVVTIRVKNLFRLNFEIDKQLFLIGLPSGLNVLLRNLSNAIFLKLVSFYDTEAIAAAGIGFRIYSFVIMPIWGLMMGSGIVVGHSLGANNPDKAKRAVKITSIDALLVISLFSLPIMFFPSQILRLFMGGQAATYVGISLLKVVGPALMVGSLIGGIGSAFTGAGMNRPLLVASFIGQWAILVPFALAVSFIFKASIGWLWSALLIGDVVELTVLVLIFKKSKWYENRL
jgi:putative MATE family efflux protein